MKEQLQHHFEWFFVVVDGSPLIEKNRELLSFFGRVSMLYVRGYMYDYYDGINVICMTIMIV